VGWILRATEEISTDEDIRGPSIVNTGDQLKVIARPSTPVRPPI
jgi:hypothetical protein